MLSEKYASEIENILARYPADQKRAAVMPLLFLAQKEYGYLPDEAVHEIASMLDLDPTQVGGLIRFYTLYYDEKGGEHRVQVCTDLPCALRGAEEFAASLSASLGVEFNQTTADGTITLEKVMCLAACDRAPMFQVQNKTGIHYHEDQSLETATRIIEGLRNGAANE